MLSGRLEQVPTVPEQMPDPTDQKHPEALQVVLSGMLEHTGAGPEQAPMAEDQRSHRTMWFRNTCRTRTR